MLLNKKYKIERFDRLNVAIWVKADESRKGSKGNWRAIKYFNNFERALRYALVDQSLGKISCAEDSRELLQVIKKLHNHIDQIAKDLASQIKAQGAA